MSNQNDRRLWRSPITATLNTVDRQKVYVLSPHHMLPLAISAGDGEDVVHCACIVALPQHKKMG